MTFNETTQILSQINYNFLEDFTPFSFRWRHSSSKRNWINGRMLRTTISYMLTSCLTAFSFRCKNWRHEKHRGPNESQIERNISTSNTLDHNITHECKYFSLLLWFILVLYVTYVVSFCSSVLLISKYSKRRNGVYLAN